VQFLDGNEVREFFDNDLGFSQEDRHMAIKRSVFGSHLLAKQGINVIVASIASTYQDRNFIRKKLGDSYLQIWVRASVETVKKRDVRGLYAAHSDGDEKNLPGLDQEYQEPRNPHLIIETDNASIDESFELIEVLLARELKK